MYNIQTEIKANILELKHCLKMNYSLRELKLCLFSYKCALCTYIPHNELFFYGDQF